MSARPFFSGRIPQSLYDALEKYRQQTNESKTDILIKALSSYINHSLEPPDLLQSRAVEISRIETLEKKLEALEQGLQVVRDLLATKLNNPVSEQPSGTTSKVEEETGQILLMLKEDVIKSDNVLDNNINNKADNSIDNETDDIDNQNSIIIVDDEIDDHSQASDNSEDNLDDNNQIEKLEQGTLTPRPSGIFIGNMKTVEVTKLAGLEDQSHTIIGGKLNRTAKGKLQTAVIGQYTCIYTGRTDKRGKTGKFEMLWDVYQTN